MYYSKLLGSMRPWHWGFLESHMRSSMAPWCRWYTAHTTTTCMMWWELANMSRRPGIHFSGILIAPTKPPNTARKSCGDSTRWSNDKHELFGLPEYRNEVTILWFWNLDVPITSFKCIKLLVVSIKYQEQHSTERECRNVLYDTWLYFI